MYGMDTTTLYPPAELRHALQEAARVRQTSEAALIREGIELVTAATRPPEPSLPLLESGDPTLAER